MKPKGFYLLYSEINEEAPDGIEKKILSQKRMFEELGLQMEFKVLKRQNGTFWNEAGDLSGADFIYFRKSTIIDWRFVSFFRQLKTTTHAIVYMEIPTYPYEGEFGLGLSVRLKLAIDKFYRTKLKGLIDHIVITGYDVGERLWEIPAINIVNGIDLSSLKVREYKKHEGIILGCIAKFSPWHGYERLIQGLAEYYSSSRSERVSIIMVGDGSEKVIYENLVEELGLGKYVEFTGKLTGDALDEVYDMIDLGICSLGRYKSGIDVIGDLKSREFMAKGIPMICGCQIDVLQRENYPYAYYVPNDSSTVNIEEILAFNKRLMTSFVCLEEEIRKAAERLVDFKSTYKKVQESVKEALWR